MMERMDSAMKARISEGAMRRIVISAALLMLILLLFQTFQVQAAERPIVILIGDNIEPYNLAAQGAKQGLQGRKTETYVLGADPGQIVHIMEKISLLSPAAVIAIGSQAALALKVNPIDPPVVFTMVVEHEQWLKRTRSWAVSMHLSPEDAYERIRQVLPKRKIAVPYNPERTGPLVEELVAYFQKHTPIQLIPMIVRKPAELGPALMKESGAYDALWILPDSSFIDALSVQYLMEYSFQQRLPVLGYSEGLSRTGAVLSLAGNYEDMGLQAAEIAQRVVAGGNPPQVTFPRRIRTYLNLRVAKVLNLEITDTLIARADRIYPLNPDLIPK